MTEVSHCPSDAARFCPIVLVLTWRCDHTALAGLASRTFPVAMATPLMAPRSMSPLNLQHASNGAGL